MLLPSPAFFPTAFRQLGSPHGSQARSPSCWAYNLTDPVYAALKSALILSQNHLQFPNTSGCPCMLPWRVRWSCVKTTYNFLRQVPASCRLDWARAGHRMRTLPQDTWRWAVLLCAKFPWCVRNCHFMLLCIGVACLENCQAAWKALQGGTRWQVQSLARERGSPQEGTVIEPGKMCSIHYTEEWLCNAIIQAWTTLRQNTLRSHALCLMQIP